MSDQARPDSVFRVDDLLVDLARRDLSRDGVQIPLAKLTFSLFEALIRAAPGVVTLDDLMKQVWGEVIVSEETLTQRISLLRQALGDDSKSPRYIKSVRGVGYRLIPAVEPLPDPQLPGAALPRRARLRLAIALAGIVLAATMLFLSLGEAPDRQAPRIKVAVLPFDDFSENQDQGYFADGMHDEIISRLAGLDAFSVVSRTSVMPYRDTSKSVPEIGAELGADVILEGSVSRSGDLVKITAQLIDATTDSHYFSETFERPLSVDNLFAIQRDVAMAVANQFDATLPARDPAALAYLPTESLEAYNQLLLGRYHLWRVNTEDLRRAVGFFEAAIDADPALAEAYAGLARSYAFIGTMYGWMPPAEAYALSESAILKALELDHSMAEIQDLHGDILAWYRWDWTGAEAAYHRANELNPNVTGLGYLLLLSVQGRTDEALALAEQFEADSPQDHWVRSNLGWRYLDLGMNQKALEHAEAVLAIDENYGDAFAIRGIVAMRRGNASAAIDDLELNVILQSRSPWSLATLATAYIQDEQIDRAELLLAELEDRAAQSHVPGESIAAINAALGRDDEALRWLAVALEQRSRGLIFLNVDRAWDGLRERPEFQDLLRRVGLI